MDNYIVVFGNDTPKSRHWIRFKSPEYFKCHYKISWGKIVDEGVSKIEAMRLCGATEELLKSIKP